MQANSGEILSPSHGSADAISIVMPAHNEAETIGGVLGEYSREVAERLHTNILICEDGSTDGTADILRRLAGTLPIRVVSDPQRLGYVGAVAKGLRLASGDVTFFSDSDGQYSPKDFWYLWERLDGSDMVIGKKVDRNEPIHRILLSRGFHVLVKALFDIRLVDIDCGFRLVRRSVVDGVLDAVGDLPYSFWAEFTILANLKGYRIHEVPVSHRNRLAGVTTIYKPKDLPKIVVRQILGLIRMRRRIGR